MNIGQIILGVVAGLVIHVGAAAPLISGVSAQQQSSGFVDITVTMEGASNDVSEAICTFVATNSATKAAIPIEHITRNGGDVGSDSVWTRKFIWDVKADAGEVKIDDVALTTVVEFPHGGVQLWEGGPYWSECNVGANKPDECGYYFWWGDTVGYKRDAGNNGWISVKDSSSFSFSKENCPTANMDIFQLRGYYIDTKGNLETYCDSAAAHLGAPWRMPTDAEFASLINYCSNIRTNLNGISGQLVTGKGAYAAKSIFLPAAGSGRISYLEDFGSIGRYWSSTPDPDYSGTSLYLDMRPSWINRSNLACNQGFPVRPVREFGSASVSVCAATTHLSVDCTHVARIELLGVTALQRDTPNGLVDIEVTMRGASNDVADVDCLFFATNSAAKAAIPVAHITRNGNDTGSGNLWTRKFIWDAKADAGEVMIDDVALTVCSDNTSDGIRLWENGPRWAECNVGATKPEDYGYYFWWGGMVGYVRSASNNRWISVEDDSVSYLFAKGCRTYGMDGTQLQLQGYINGTGNLSQEFDAATANLDMPWRMPTDAEWATIISNCTTTWTTRNGVNGLLVMGKGAYSSRGIFLPAGGYGYLDYRNSFNLGGYYWSSTPYSENTHYARGAVLTSIDFRRNYDCARDTGRSVRPLRDVDVADLSVEGMATTHLALDFRVQPLPQGGPYTETVDGVAWTFMVNSDLTASVGGGSSDSTGVQVSMTGDVSVPTTLGGRSVTSVGPYAFYDCRGLTSMSIPNGVTNISERAFASCTSLRSAEIPSTVENIGSYAFSGCTSLLSVTLPNGLRTISNSAFKRCKALTAITIPQAVTSIGNDSFEECTSLTSVDIPSAVTSIGSYAFSGCEELATVELHEGLERIGESAFSRCSKLSSYSIPASVLSVSRFSFINTKRYLDVSAAATDCIIMDDCLFCLASTALSNIKDLAIPSGVRVIADSAFVDAAKLESVTLPDTVRSIGASAFCGSTISSITIPADSVRIIGNSAFEASHLVDIDVPEGVETIMERAFAKCDKLKTVAIAGTVRSIGASCFSQSYYVQSVSLGEGVERIGREAFLDMGYQWVYWNGSNSVKIDIPSTITKIGASAFSGTGYRSVAANVADIATWCEAEFADASSVPWHQQYGGKIDHFTYPDLKIPYGPSRISSYAFAFWNYGGSIDLPRSVKRIESNAFYSSKMVSILIPSTVAEIEKGAFDYCSNLKTIYVSENDTARVKEMMRGMMNIVNGKSVEMNVDDWEFIEISAVEFSTAESVAEVFGDGSAMAECVKDPTQLAAFNTFISDCGITSVESISAAQKQYAYQSFKLAEITTAPRLFEEEPVLRIDDVELSGGNLSLTISLTAGAEAIQLAKDKLAEKIRVGTTLGNITGKPTIVASPADDGTSLTFTITPPEGNQGFVKVLID